MTTSSQDTGVVLKPDKFAAAIISHLLHIEETLLATIEDFAPETRALQSRRVGELRYLLGRLTVAATRTPENQDNV